MKVNKLTIVLLIIIFVLVSYIIFDKLKNNYSKEQKDPKDEIVKITDTIKLDYVKIMLASDGTSYIVPLNNEEINKIQNKKNLQDRLKELYIRAFYYDIFVDNNKLKGFRTNVDDKIKSIRKIIINSQVYIVFIKENNKIALFNYEDYLDNFNTIVIDNYNDYQNVSDIKDNKLIYLDGSSDTFRLEK